MKMKLAVLFFAVFATLTSQAQIKVGLKAGSNIGKIEGKSFEDEFSYGYLAGGFAEVKLGKKLGIQPEVLFTQLETKVDSNFRNIYRDAVNSSSNGEVKLNYLAIPIMLNYKVANILTLQAGPQFGIKMNQDKDLMENGSDAFDKGDLSLLGGAQINISKFRISGRYGVGLQNINDIDDQDKWTNQSIQVAVGFTF